MSDLSSGTHPHDDRMYGTSTTSDLSRSSVSCIMMSFVTSIHAGKQQAAPPTTSWLRARNIAQSPDGFVLLTRRRGFQTHPSYNTRTTSYTPIGMLGAAGFCVSLFFLFCSTTACSSIPGTYIHHAKPTCPYFCGIHNTRQKM